MATNYEYDDEDDFNMEDSTDVVKQLRKVNRTLEKRLKELEQEANTLKTTTRQRTVKDVLTSKGINPKVAAFIPQDIEPTEDAISSWLNEYGDVFGAVKQEDGQVQAQAQTQATPDLSANQRMQNVAATGTPPQLDEDTMAKILAAQDPETLNKILGISVI